MTAGSGAHVKAPKGPRRGAKRLDVGEHPAMIRDRRRAHRQTVNRPAVRVYNTLCTRLRPSTRGAAASSAMSAQRRARVTQTR